MTTARASHALPQPDESGKRPNLEVVRRAKRRRSRRTGSGVVGTTLVIGLFGAVFAVVVLQVLLVQSQSRLDGLDARIAREQTTAKQLRDRITALESPERVVASAKDRLGMMAPADLGYLQPKADDDARATYDPAEAPTTTTSAAPVTTTTARSSATTSATSASGSKGTTATTKASTATSKATMATTTSSGRRATTATSAARSTATTTRSSGAGTATGATR